MFSASNTARLLFFNISVLVMIGVWLTGFDNVHWFVYVLPGFMLIAAATGFCPGLLISGRVLRVLGIKE